LQPGFLGLIVLDFCTLYEGPPRGHIHLYFPSKLFYVHL